MIQKITGPDDLARLREALASQRDPDKPCVTVCSGTGCHGRTTSR